MSVDVIAGVEQNAIDDSSLIHTSAILSPKNAEPPQLFSKVGPGGF